MPLLFCSFIFLATALCAFEYKPWLLEPYKMEVDSSYDYSSYSAISGGEPSVASKNSHLLFLARMAVMEDLEVEGEIEFLQSHFHAMTFESVGLLARYRFFNDLLGDKISLLASFSARVVPAMRLRDPTVPYHHVGNFELGFTLGKEASREGSWSERAFAFLAVGMADRGSPWLRARAHFLQKSMGSLFFELWSEGYFGFGSLREVKLSTFRGYYDIHHSSVDLALRVSQKVGPGRFSFQYDRRLLAIYYPSHYQSFTARYDVGLNPLS